jgi:Ni/Fe-hydrogenase subunit HybB-like protein
MALQNTSPRDRLVAHLKATWLFYIWILLLTGLFLLGGYAYYLDRTQELAAITNVVPWGLGIVIDVSGIAIAAGAFVLVSLTYLFGRKEFEPLVRVSLLVGILGYSAAGLALLTDLGRPDRFWHILVYLNSRSILSVVAWCLMVFTTVLVLQLIPVLRDAPFARRWPLIGGVASLLQKVMPFLVLVGALFSLTHQGAAGATFGVVKSRAIWYRPTLPIVFAGTAIFSGLGFVLMMVAITERVTRMRRRLVDRQILVSVARIAGLIGIVILVVRVWEQLFIDYYSPQLYFAQQISVLNTQTPYSLGVLIGELVLGTLVPVIIFLSPQAPTRARNLLLGGLLATFGLLVNRWDTTLSGLVASVSYSPSNPEVVFNSYFPSGAEWLIGLGILAFCLLAYSIGVRILPIFQPLPEEG